MDNRREGSSGGFRALSASWLVVALLGCAGAAGQGDSSALPSTGATTAAPSDKAPPRPTEPAVSGVVKAPDGKPVDGALVVAIEVESAEVAGRARTSGGGRFRIAGLKPGKYGLTATAKGLTAGYGEAFDLPPGKPLEGQNLALGGASVTLRGLVRHADGQPAPRAQLTAVGLSQRDIDTFVVESDERGQYEMMLPEGKYGVWVESPGEEAELFFDGRDQTIDVELGRIYPDDKPPPTEVVTWLKQNAIPLTTVEAEHGFADLAPLRDVVGKARVVSLGEATHGTREFFQLKHRMLEFLATEMGFDAFAIEAGFAEGLAINAYVLGGKGDPAALVSGMGYFPWDTEEVVALVRWMRKYNDDSAHKRKLRFYGFDMNSLPESAAFVLEYLQKADPEGFADARRLLAPLDTNVEMVILDKSPAKSQPEPLLAQVDALIKRFDEKKVDYQKRTSPAAWALARLGAQTVRQALVPVLKGFDPAHRDRSMAENVRALLDIQEPGSKMVLWAHNAHVSRTTPRRGAPMGKVLHEALGAEHVVIGFAFGAGSFQAMQIPPPAAPGLQKFTVGSLPPGSLDATLAQVGPPLFALDMRRAPAGSAAAEWLRARIGSRSVGSHFADRLNAQMISRDPPARSFDALLFVRDTSPARPLDASRWLPPPPAQKMSATANLGFEEGAPGALPEGWSLRTKGYLATLSSERPHGGKRCVELTRDKASAGEDFGMLTQRLDATPYRGKRVRVHAFARADVKGAGNEARFIFMARSANPNLMAPSTLFSSTPEPIVAAAWKDQTIEATVPADADSVDIGLVLSGNGRAFLDDVAIEVVGAAKP